LREFKAAQGRAIRKARRPRPRKAIREAKEEP